MYASYKVLGSNRQRQSTAQNPGMGRRGQRQPSDMLRNPPSAAQLPETERWVMYWCIAASMTLAESWIGWLWNWVPMYEVLKLLFILWLVMPQTNGAALIFAHYLTPFLAAYERDIDKVVSSANGWSLDLVANILQAVANTLRAQLATLVGPVLQAAPAPVQGMPVPPSQHNPAQGVISQAASALQVSAPIVMGIGTAIANWIMAASQQASDAAHPEEPPAPSPQPRRSVSGPQTSPRPPQTEVLRTRRIFSPNPLDDPGRL